MAKAHLVFRIVLYCFAQGLRASSKRYGPYLGKANPYKTLHRVLRHFAVLLRTYLVLFFSLFFAFCIIHFNYIYSNTMCTKKRRVLLQALVFRQKHDQSLRAPRDNPLRCVLSFSQLSVIMYYMCISMYNAHAHSTPKRHTRGCKIFCRVVANVPI